jgi:hypothetical protein
MAIERPNWGVPAVATEAAVPAPAAESVPTAGISSAFDESRTQAAAAGLQTILRGIPAEEQLEFAEVFSALPAEVEEACLHVLSGWGPVRAKPAPDGVVASFRSDEAHAEAMRLWGPQAPQRLGMALARLAAIRERVSEAGWAKLMEAVDALPDDAYRGLFMAIGRARF